MALCSMPTPRRQPADGSPGKPGSEAAIMKAGRIALVTGGRGGIGRAICARFLREGVVVIAADLTKEGSSSDSTDCTPFVRFDVTSEDDARATMAQIERECGKLDILVNAAGIEIEKT